MCVHNKWVGITDEKNVECGWQLFVQKCSSYTILIGI